MRLACFSVLGVTLLVTACAQDDSQATGEPATRQTYETCISRQCGQSVTAFATKTHRKIPRRCNSSTVIRYGGTRRKSWVSSLVCIGFNYYSTCLESQEPSLRGV